MAGTDIGQSDPAANQNDHTYYGNGCSTSEYPEGKSGSDKACSTRIIKTGDNEDQKNGTYYSFQAATSGSGATITTDNTDAPDTFCPLGWQVPYGGTGGDYYDKSRSRSYLLESYNIVYATGGYALRSYPLSYVLAGDYATGNGMFYNQGSSGIYSSSTAASLGGYYWFAFFDNRILGSQTVGKNDAEPIRCIFI